MDNITTYVILAALVAFLLWRNFGPNKKASPALVLAKIEAGARVIDVRTPDEFRGGGYPKAMNIPLGELSSKIDRLKPLDKPIVLYCASGARSSQAAGLLKKAGFTDITNGGGLSAMPK
ncbi:MAG: rhodanese-like domain-containing protein [Spirochaetota bacterium]